MAIINTNQITLSDSGLTLDESVVVGHDFQGSCRKPNILNIKMQVNFFADFTKWQASITNKLNVEGFNKIPEFSYNTLTDESNIFYFFDLELKEYLLKLYPEWDADKLIITTEPLEV